MTSERFVLDTNVLVSAVLWGGAPRQLFALAETGRIQLFTSEPLLHELSRTLGKPKLAKFVAATGRTRSNIVRNYRAFATVVHPQRLAVQVSRDADDDVVLACGIAAAATAIVTGDEDLKILGHYAGIPIVSVARALDKFA